MRKKWIILIILILSILNLPPFLQYAYARWWQGCLPGFCVGATAGCCIGSHLRGESPPPPKTCYREVSGHWETKWNIEKGIEEKTWVPAHNESYPCP